MLKVLEAMTVDALLLQRPNDTLDHPVLLGTVGRDELLLQPIAPDEAGVVPTGKTRPLSDLSRKGF